MKPCVVLKAKFSAFIKYYAKHGPTRNGVLIGRGTKRSEIQMMFVNQLLDSSCESLLPLLI